MKRSANPTRSAFTLVEVLVVLAIIAVLAAITMGIYGAVKGKAEDSRLSAELAAIELALEDYKAKNGQYPYSDEWKYVYPPRNWGAQPVTPLGNNLYRDLVAKPMAAGKKPHLPDVKESQHQGDSLLAPVVDVRSGAPNIKWYYNSHNPRFNKDSFDLWVEYGDTGENPNDPSDDNVKIISNWNQ